MYQYEPEEFHCGFSLGTQSTKAVKYLYAVQPKPQIHAVSTDQRCPRPPLTAVSSTKNLAILTRALYQAGGCTTPYPCNTQHSSRRLSGTKKNGTELEDLQSGRPSPLGLRLNCPTSSSLVSGNTPTCPAPLAAGLQSESNTAVYAPSMRSE